MNSATKLIYYLFLLIVTLFFYTSPIQAQFSFGQIKEQSSETNVSATPVAVRGTLTGEQKIQKYKAGISFEARQNGTCKDVVATIPVPMEFPEQKVRILEEEFPKPARIFYREVKEGGAKQLVIKMSVLRPGQKIEAWSLFEVTRIVQYPPKETKCYTAPKKLSKQLRHYLKESPNMEVDSRLVRTAAKEAIAGKESAWAKVEGIFDYVRTNVEYKEVLAEGAMRGALSALRTKAGDCEDMCALFISMCRSQDIPARLVHVEGHCYAEFCLTDETGKEYWFPAQVAGKEAFGGMLDTRIILQKGDNFRTPEEPKQSTSYIKELFMGNVAENAPNPRYQFIKEIKTN